MTGRGGAEGYLFTGVRVIPARGRVEARGKFAKKRTDRVDKSLVNKVEGQEVSKKGETDADVDVDVDMVANGNGNTGKRDQEESVATSPSKRVKLDTEVEAEVANEAEI